MSVMGRRPKSAVSAAMRQVRSRDTSPEKSLRKALWGTGLRYRLHSRRLPGNPDIVFPSAKVAVFVDGDFWHGNQWRLRGHSSLEQQFEGVAHASYWIPKIRRTIERDAEASRRLAEMGWAVIRCWESEIRSDSEGCANRIAGVVRHRSARTFADFFAGIGLAQLGLEAAGWQAKFANDIDPKKHEMYKSNFGDDGVYLPRNIHKVDASEVPDVTLWWASFPCTDMSLAGYRRGLAGSESGSLAGFLTLLNDKDGQRPGLVVLENVTGFLTSQNGRDFVRTIRELNKRGYSCDAFVLDAIHFVPQSRPRLFIVGVYDCPAAEDVEEALSQRDPRLTNRQLTDVMTRSNGLNWTILDMRPPSASDVSLTNVLQRLPLSSPRWWSKERVQYLLDQMSVRHRKLVEHLKVSKKMQYATVYRRMRNGKSTAELRADNISGCLRTPRGGSSRQILLVAGRGIIRARYMTPREYARLMGAPDYKISGKRNGKGTSDNQAYFGFGDAVCVPLVQWIGRNVLKPAMKRTSVAAGRTS